MGDLVEQSHGELVRTLYYHDALLTDGMEMASGACTRLDSEWSKRCFTLIRMAWKPSVSEFLYDRIVMGIGMT